MALKRIGAVWRKTDKKDQDFFSGAVDLGMLGEARIMLFQVDQQGENFPAYTVHLVTGETITQ